MSPYAAGCAVCGADLDTQRWDRGPGLGARLSSAFNAVSFGALPTWLLAGVAVLVLLYLVR